MCAGPVGAKLGARVRLLTKWPMIGWETAAEVYLHWILTYLYEAEVETITTHDDFLLELGQTLGGQAGVRPVDSVEAALENLKHGKRGQVLVIDRGPRP